MLQPTSVATHPSGGCTRRLGEFWLTPGTLADILDAVAESALRDNITAILGGLLGAVRLVAPTQHV
jgi:hypothetical protein